MKKKIVSLLMIMTLLVAFTLSAFAYVNCYMDYSIISPSTTQYPNPNVYQGCMCSNIRFGGYNTDIWGTGSVTITLIRTDENLSKFKYDSITLTDGQSSYKNVAYNPDYTKWKIKVVRNGAYWVTGTAYYYTQ